MGVGATLPVDLKADMIAACDNDDWAKHEEKRKEKIDELKNTILKYDNKNPIKITSKGLLETIAENLKNNMMNYPDEVKNYIEEMYAVLEEDGFFKDNEIEENGKKAFIEVAGPQFMKRWVSGDMNEVIDEDDTLKLILKQTMALGLLFNVKDKGLLGLLDDENGDEFFYLTQEGHDFLDQNPETDFI